MSDIKFTKSRLNSDNNNNVVASKNSNLKSSEANDGVNEVRDKLHKDALANFRRELQTDTDTGTSASTIGSKTQSDFRKLINTAAESAAPTSGSSGGGLGGVDSVASMARHHPVDPHVSL